MLLSGADRNHFRAMRDDLVNDFAKGYDSYDPPTMEDVLPLVMNGYKSQCNFHRFGQPNDATGIDVETMFAQDCGEMGQVQCFCPRRRQSNGGGGNQTRRTPAHEADAATNPTSPPAPDQIHAIATIPARRNNNDKDEDE